LLRSPPECHRLPTRTHIPFAGDASVLSLDLQHDPVVVPEPNIRRIHRDVRADAPDLILTLLLIVSRTYSMKVMLDKAISEKVPVRKVAG
jgi:hypothetical protein